MIVYYNKLIIYFTCIITSLAFISIIYAPVNTVHILRDLEAKFTIVKQLMDIVTITFSSKKSLQIAPQIKQTFQKEPNALKK